jgi:FkbM family methyltransferase
MKLRSVFKPEYVFKPSTVLRRVAAGFAPPREGRVTARTPWGWDIEVHSGEDVGRAILHLGLYELAASETIWRLTDPGESALDLGANVGYMTSLLARRVGPSGRVVCFEAHPEIAAELRANVARWEPLAGPGVIQVRETALSDREGTVRLEMPAHFATNRGVARVVSSEGGGEPGAATIEVTCETLDAVLAGMGPVGLAKMDVEGHEEAVLRGAKGVLGKGQVRDWVFEHHPDYPSPVTELFEGAHYHVFQIQKQFFGPALAPAADRAERSIWEPTNYLATLDPGRALNRLRPRGWKVLRPS